ncbi:MAG: hypothetical protein EXR71_10140 [Myxococcales bacterium]|nr:hypothetical protein [Myxococcales bacterium]
MLQLVFLALLADPAHADEALRARVIDLLSGIETSPSAADWAALGPAAAGELIVVATDSAALPTQRGNALIALGNFPSPAARDLLTETVSATSAAPLLRRKAALGLARGWGGAAVPTLSAALGDADVQVRMSAARALSGLDDDAARAALRARLGAEPDAAVRTLLAAGGAP